MQLIDQVISFLFSIALIINALLFVPQSVLMLKRKNSKGVSLITFLGILILQSISVMYGLIKNDQIIIFGYLFSMLTCGSVVLLILWYRRQLN